MVTRVWSTMTARRPRLRHGRPRKGSMTIRTTILIAASIGACCAGCVRTPPPIPPPANSKALDAVLTELLLDPSVTCEELQQSFHLEYLDLVDNPGDLGLDYDEIFVSVDPQTSLRVWDIHSALDRGTVVFSMGAVANLSCYLFTARLLANNGWSVVMYEYRGFGRSTGVPDLSTLEDDLSAVLDWVLARNGGEPVTLMGLSIGTIPTVSVAVQRPEDVNGVILDSPVALGELLKNFNWILRDQTQTFINLARPGVLSENIIQNLQAPLLILAGDRDQLTTFSSVQLLYDRAGGPKKLVVFPGVTHARARFDDTGRYTSEVEKFLSDVWNQRVPIEPAAATSDPNQ